MLAAGGVTFRTPEHFAELTESKNPAQTERKGKKQAGKISQHYFGNFMNPTSPLCPNPYALV